MEENKNTEPGQQAKDIPEEIPGVIPNTGTEETAMPETGGIKTEEKTETLNLNLTTEENMEVHHHGQVHEKKEWKEYLFQFFMLFLAVFCGFLAEYQLEHYIEKERAKGLIASLITDLKKDTATINTLERFRLSTRKPRLDSFYSLVTMPPDKVEKKIYYQMLWNIAEYYSFNQSTGTINQLKNAGYLRYFSDSYLLNYISDYEYWIHDFKGDETMEFHLHYDKLIDIIKQNSDTEDMHSFYILNKLPEGTGIKPFKPEILQSLKAYLIEVMWYNHPQMQKQNERVKSKAVKLLNYLQARYKIKDE